jgi:hypothetical protein
MTAVLIAAQSCRSYVMILVQLALCLLILRDRCALTPERMDIAMLLPCMRLLDVTCEI